MPGLKKNIKKFKFQKNNRKKHVETMFLTNKQKNYPYYFKVPIIQNLKEINFNKHISQRNIFYIKCLDSGYLSINPLKAIIRIFKFFLKTFNVENMLKYRLYVFPDFVLTAKPKEIRMGKGKGKNYKKVAIVKAGQYILSLTCKGTNQNLIIILLKKMIHKLPFRAIILKNNW